MARIQSICTSDWGSPIEQAVRNVAGFLALIYTAGFVFGQWLHNLNDWLAGKQPQTIASAVIQNDAPVSDDIEAIADLVFSDRPGVDRVSQALLIIANMKVSELRSLAQKMGYGRSMYRVARRAELFTELNWCARSSRFDRLAAILGI